MKTMKYLIYVSAVSLALSTALVACGKKSEDTNNTLTVGSLTSDGLTVTSTTTVGGYPLSLTLQNFKTGQVGCSYNYGVQTCTSNLTYSVLANNQMGQLTTTPRFNANSSRAQTTIAGFQVLHQSMCFDSTCALVAVEVILGTGYEYRQIVVKREMSTGKIVNMFENTSSGNNVRPLSTVMQTL